MTNGIIKPCHLPNMPASQRRGHQGDTVITTFNLENLFGLADNGDNWEDKVDERGSLTPEQLETKLAKLALAIRLELRLPEIIVVQEVGSAKILQQLGGRVNTAAGTAYAATSFDTSDRRGLEIGFLWDASRVDLTDAFQLSGAEVEAAFGPGSPRPGREPLVGIFKIKGREVTIVGNHFKSMLGDDTLSGINGPPVSITEVQRKAQARVVRSFVNSIVDKNPDALLMVTGDLNDFRFNDPDKDHPVAILEGGAGETPLTNLINLGDKEDVFTFIFDGRTQMLDHMLVSPALLKLFVAVDILHFNAGFPLNLSEDTSTTRRSSDHDPLEGRFNFQDNGKTSP